MDRALGDRLRKVFAGFPEVEAVYLFGSMAEGHANAGSDIDLGLVVSKPLGIRKLDILAELTTAGVDNVDLVTLDTNDIVLRFEVVGPNQLIYARETFDHGTYFSRTVREYFDFQPYLEVQRKAFKERLERG